MNCIVNGKSVNYSVTGKGSEVVLLLHGWGDSLVTFKDLLSPLSKEYTVVSVDLPGFGGSEVPENAWDLDDYAQFIRDFLKKIGYERIYAVVGHSNGGAVAIRGISMSVITTDKLVLLAASGIRLKGGFGKSVVKLVAKTGKYATFWLPTRYRQKLQKKLYGTIGSDFLVVPQMKETFKKTVAQDVQEDAGTIDIPTLLIYGDQDKATPPEFGRIYVELIKGSRLELIEGADHFVHHSDSETVCRLVAQHLGDGE